MNTPSTDREHHAGWYRIQVKGRLASRWNTRFDGMTLTARADGTTVIEGPIVDQAALHGLLNKLGDLGLPLLSITQMDPATPTGPIPPPAPATETIQGD